MRSHNMPQKSAETIQELEFDQSSRHLKYSILEQRLYQQDHLILIII